MKGSLIRALVMCSCFVSLLAGCGGDDGGSTAGECKSFSPCGGDPAGSWQLDAVCLDDLDQLFADISDQPACKDFFRDSRLRPTGTYTFSDGMYSTAGAGFTFELDVVLTSTCASALAGTRATVDQPTCQRFESQLASEGGSIAGASCKLGTGGCGCTVTSVPMELDEAGTYMVSGNNLVEPSGSSAFCVNGDTLTIQGTSAMGIGGTLVLHRK